MKKIFIFLFAITLFSACSNDPAVDAAFTKYSSHNGIISITVPGFVIKAATAFGDLDPEEKQLLRNVDKVKVLAIEDDYRYKEVDFHKEFAHMIKDDSYTELLSVNDKNEHVRIFAKMQDKERIKDLIVLVGGDDSALVYIKGDFTMDEIANVINKNNHGSFHNLVKF